MQQSRSCIKDSNDFINKLKEIKEVPKDTIMVTADVVGLYPSIPHNVGLEALRRTLNDRVNKKIGTEDLIKMAEFVLKNNKTTTMNLMVKLNNNFLRLPSVRSLRLHALVYLWIKLKLNFLGHKYTSHWYDFGT